MRVLDVGSGSGDVSFLADRMRDEVVAGGGVVVTPPLVVAWSRKP
jgi:hypothetical protein